VCKRVAAPGGGGMVNKCEYVPPAGSKASTPSRIVFVGDGYEITPDQTRGYSGQDLVADRELCFAAGLRIVRNSFNACSKLPTLERLSAYASGNCNDGREASRRRVGAAIRWIDQYPPPVNDEQLVALLSTPAVIDSTPDVTPQQGLPSLPVSFRPTPASPDFTNLALQP
jgi:hypothetical protein